MSEANAVEPDDEVEITLTFKDDSELTGNFAVRDASVELSDVSGTSEVCGKWPPPEDGDKES